MRTLLRATMHSSALQPATITRPSVLVRSIATQRASSIQPPATMRSLVTQPAGRTRPTVFMRLVATQRATETRSSVYCAPQHNGPSIRLAVLRARPTQLAKEIRLTAVIRLCNTTADDNTARDGALRNNTTGLNTANGAFAHLAIRPPTTTQPRGWCASKQHNRQRQYCVRYPSRCCLTTGDNNIDIGNLGVAGEANTIRIGTAGTQTAAYIAGIAGVTVTGNPVVIDGSGHLGTVDITYSPGPCWPARSTR